MFLSIFCPKDLVPFWDEMALIDNNCWILEPAKPTKTDLHRRINLNVNNVSMNIKIDPRNPKDLPGNRSKNVFSRLIG
jgi:hypothetical protein